MRYFLLAACLCIGTLAAAHNPLAAKFELEVTSPDITLLHVYLSQTGLHQALSAHHHNTDLMALTADAYKRLATAYVKEHVHLSADGTYLLIGEGGIKLGSHETDFKFIIDNYPDTVKSLSVDIDAFAENDHHTSVFWWKRGAEKSKLVLYEENDYRGVLGLQSLLASTPEGGGSLIPSLLVFLGAVIVAALYLFLGEAKPHIITPFRRIARVPNMYCTRVPALKTFWRGRRCGENG